MKKAKNAFPIFATVCSLLTLIFIFIIVFSTRRQSHTVTHTEYNSEMLTEYVYVYIEPDTTADTEIASAGWMLREHNGKIGIFSTESGELLEVLEVHIKTLPTADRALLREGISARSKKELLSLIEDYTE